MNLTTALELFSRMCSLESLQMLETERLLVTAMIMESWPEILQMIQKPTKGCTMGLKKNEKKNK